MERKRFGHFAEEGLSDHPLRRCSKKPLPETSSPPSKMTSKLK